MRKRGEMTMSVWSMRMPLPPSRARRDAEGSGGVPQDGR